MNVFLSWAGPKSGGIAEVLRQYLPSLINRVNPFLSSQDVATGARWSAEIAKNLEASNVGVVCATAKNQHEPWLLFEAGAISKLTAVQRAMVLRIDMKAGDVTGPLSQFQSVSLDRQGIWSIVSEINAATETPVLENTLALTFNNSWPAMEKAFESVLASADDAAAPKRDTAEILEEVLELTRQQDRAMKHLTNRLDEDHFTRITVPRSELTGIGSSYWDERGLIHSPMVRDVQRQQTLSERIKNMRVEPRIVDEPPDGA